MEQIIARCGFRCDMCMAYAGNINSYGDQVKVAEAWSNYFGIEISADKVKCPGCLSTAKSEDLPDRECPVRPCVIEKEMNTCADCFDFSCEKLESRLRFADEAIAKFRGKISEEEFHSFIAPYAGRKILQELRDRRVDRVD